MSDKKEEYKGCSYGNLVYFSVSSGICFFIFFLCGVVWIPLAEYTQVAATCEVVDCKVDPSTCRSFQNSYTCFTAHYTFAIPVEGAVCSHTADIQFIHENDANVYCGNTTTVPCYYLKSDPCGSLVSDLSTNFLGPIITMVVSFFLGFFLLMFALAAYCGLKKRKDYTFSNMP